MILHFLMVDGWPKAMLLYGHRAAIRQIRAALSAEKPPALPVSIRRV